jgi:hypothetical protein
VTTKIVQPFSAKEEVERILAFANRMLFAMGIYAHVFVSLKTVDHQDTHTEAIWAGVTPTNDPSRAYWIAVRKGMALMASPMLNTKPYSLLLTPIEGMEEYMGGIRVLTEELDIAIAVSKLDQAHDRLIAGCIMYAYLFQEDMEMPLTLHHVGTRGTKDEFAHKIAEWGGNALVCPVSDHSRAYMHVGPHYLEQQYFQNGPWDGARHWDFVANDPIHFLTFLAYLYETDPVLWDAGKNDPIGMVSIMGENSPEVIFSVMARPKWWDVTE